MRGADAALGDVCCDALADGDDQTVWAEAATAAAADDDEVESEACDLGRAAECARKAARKFEKKGRLLVMVDI